VHRALHVPLHRVPHNGEQPVDEGLYILPGVVVFEEAALLEFLELGGHLGHAAIALPAQEADVLDERLVVLG